MGAPTILLVPGPWFPGKVYDALIASLQANYPYDSLVAPYPSNNPQGDANVSCETDTAHGGMPGAGAATGLGKRLRTSAGQSGGVISLIMASGFALGENVSCAGAIGGALAPWVPQDNLSKGLCMPDDPCQIFEADVEQSVAEENLKILVLHLTHAFLSPPPKPAFSDEAFEGLCAYIELMQDEAVPVAGQEAMMQYSGVKWVTKELQMSHNAGFGSKTDEMAATVAELVQEFRSKI